jgi:hypothetical protein
MNPPQYGPFRTDSTEGLAFDTIHVLNKKIETYMRTNSKTKSDIDYQKMRETLDTDLKSCGCDTCLSYLKDISLISEDEDLTWKFLIDHYPWLIARSYGENVTFIVLKPCIISSALGTMSARYLWSYYLPQGRCPNRYYNWNTKEYGEPVTRGSLVLQVPLEGMVQRKPKMVFNEEVLIKCLSLVYTLNHDLQVFVDSTHDPIKP